MKHIVIIVIIMLFIICVLSFWLFVWLCLSDNDNDSCLMVSLWNESQKREKTIVKSSYNLHYDYDIDNDSYFNDIHHDYDCDIDYFHSFVIKVCSNSCLSISSDLTSLSKDQMACSWHCSLSKSSDIKWHCRKMVLDFLKKTKAN